MTTALYLVLSGILIGAGIAIIWRDVRKKSRGSFILQRGALELADPEVEVTVARAADPEFARRAPARSAATLASSFMAARGSHEARAAPGDGAQALAPPPVPHLVPSLAPPLVPSLARSLAPPPVPSLAPPQVPSLAPPPASAAQIAQSGVDRSRQSARLALERQWSALQPAIAGAVARTNTLVAPLLLFIGPAGEPAWSYKNRGYGVHRRLLMAAESVAWLRLELLAEGRLRANVKAHRDDGAGLNASAEMAVAGVDSERVAALLRECLQPATAFATRHIEISEVEASKRAWESVNGMIAAALSATNGALAQAGARLIELAPATWENELRHHRMALSVEVNGDDVARMHIERLPHELEVAVGVREPQLAALGRRRRIPVDGMTIHALAELIASCAWPAIARFKETRRQV
jgi:hypothetical protein